MDSYYFLEEELISKMHMTFVQQFSFDTILASELAVEILEIIRSSESQLPPIQ